MMNPEYPRNAARKAAFTLVEVTLALGVTAFCLLAIFGLLPIGLRSNQATLEQTAANGILTAVAADLRATPSTSGSSQQFGIIIPPNPVTTGNAATSGTSLFFTAGGLFANTSKLSWTPTGGTTAVTATHMRTVTFIPPNISGSTGRIATFVNLEVSWPAASGTAYATGMVQTFVALDRN